MTLYELSLEYEQTAAMLRGRISELERVLRETGDGPRRNISRSTSTVSGRAGYSWTGG